MAEIHGKDIVRDGLVLHLDAANPQSFDGNSTIWRDLSGNGNHGTMYNGPTYNSSNKGSVVFDGVNDYVDCGSTAVIGSSLTGLTVCAWVYPTVAATKLILENGGGYITNTFYLAQENSSYFSFEVYGSNGVSNGYDVVLSNYSYSINTWYYLVGTWTPNVSVQFYSNGVLHNGTRGAGSPRTTLINGNTNLYAGIRPSSSYPFGGKMGNIEIYNRTLSQSEITQNYNATKSRYGL